MYGWCTGRYNDLQQSQGWLCGVCKYYMYAIILYKMLLKRTTSFGVVNLMYRLLRRSTTQGWPCCVCTFYIYSITLHIMLLRHRTDFGVVQGIFTPTHSIETMVTAPGYVYNPAISTGLLYTMLAVCSTRFGVVQLMYRPLRWSTTTQGWSCCICTYYMYSIMFHMMLLRWRTGFGVLQYKQSIRRTVIPLCSMCMYLTLQPVCSIRC